MSSSLEEHYGLLLGLRSGWRVERVDLSLEEQRVEIVVVHGPESLCCPECGERRPMKDRSPSRSWRHLDTMQFETVITARLPRVDCPVHGVKQVVAPWAEPHGRFTSMFEAFAIRVLRSSSSVQRACDLLGLKWDAVQEIMNRAVERGLERRSVDDVKHIGLDEKSFGKGQDYVSVLTDIDGRRVLDVVPGRDQAAAEELLRTLPEEQLKKIEAAATDMSAAYAAAVGWVLPDAAIVHDRFHVEKLLGEALDEVRRAEHKELRGEGDFSLKGTKYLLLHRPENLDEADREWLDAIRGTELKTARAWAIRDYFRWFWEYARAGNARKFFDGWHAWAVRSRLPSMKRVARTLKKHLPRLLTWFKHRISNGPAEGFNSVIQSLKSAARGFRSFANYRTRILFFTGKLAMAPETGT